MIILFGTTDRPESIRLDVKINIIKPIESHTTFDNIISIVKCVFVNCFSISFSPLIFSSYIGMYKDR